MLLHNWGANVPNAHSMRPISGPLLSMVKRFNWPTMTTRRCLTNLASNLSNKFLASSYFMVGQSTKSSLLHSMKSRNSQARPTEKTAKACTMLLDYCATHSNTIIRLYTSDMSFDGAFGAASRGNRMTFCGPAPPP